MEVFQPEPAAEGEGANTGKAPPKDPPPKPQHGKRKARKKKKKKKAAQEKQPSKSRKQPVRVKSALELPQPHSNDETPQEDTTRATTPSKATRDLLSPSSPSVLLSTRGGSGPAESLRWEGILEDPVAEAERMWNYRLNRRKRYGAYIQQNLPPAPSFTLKRLPRLCKPAQAAGELLLRRSKSSPAVSEANTPSPKATTKVSKRQLGLPPSISQEMA
ncbi:protein LIAT1 [Varanus komodoensis]|uniref:protein LIAT1 n=1 Tax=Varanus komodoensis TaxID=61221 RepID=UPI001CF770BD|nr:protein LIAT1 [Varanus komodoensis]